MSVEDNLLSIIEIKEKDKNKQSIFLQNLLNEFDINHVRKSNQLFCQVEKKKIGDR